jgi:hypothetical protein
MCSRIIKFTSIFIFVLFIFNGGCKSPFTPSETLPVIWVNAFSISFNCAEVGANPAPQILQVKNTGPNTLNYTIDDDANFYDVDWLTITPANGSSSGQIVEHTIVVDKAGMTSRDSAYNAKITISSSDAYNSPQKVDVSLKIEKEPPPEIDVSPQSLAFSAKQGAVSNPSSQTLRVRNTGQQSLNYTISDDANWLNVTPKSGSSTGGENTHSVSVNVKGLSEGTYKGKIIITDANASNSPKNVEVTLSVSQKPPPVISVTPASLSFSGKQGGANPASQSIRIKNSGEATLNYSITDDANWLSVNPASGSSTGQEMTHTVSVNIGGLGEGSYNGIITITDSNANNSPQTVGVTLTVSKKPPPEIGVSSTSLTFSGKEGGSNPSSQIIRIKNNGGETLNYSITDDANWLSVNPTSGSSTGQEIAHTVSANIGNLSEGTYNATITITDANAVNSPQKVGVTLTLSKQTPPQISVNPTSLTFSGKEGGSNPSSQSIRIKNSGGGSLDYSITDDANWLSVNPTSGSSTGGENTHTISVNTGGLSNGTYSGTITISSSGASNSSQTVKVALTISEKPPPVISVTPTSLTFSSKVGASDPSSQSIKIRNSGEGTLNYSITDNANWLSVSPTSGSSTGGENSHTVSVSISGLNEGTHTGTITITDSNASNSPQTVSVTLTLTKDQPPQISVTPASLAFSAERGGSDPSAQNIRIRNSGQQTLSYTISDDAGWLSVNPASGSSTGGENNHTVSVSIGSLSAGTYTGTITITDSNASNSPQTVSVTLTISEPPPPVISVTPTSLSFSAQQGGPNPSSKSIGIRNSGGQTLNYTISVNEGWLIVNPTTGSSTGQEIQHTVTANISGLSPGVHYGTITISDNGGTADPETVEVTLTISALPSDNEISVSCSPPSGGNGTQVTISINIKGNIEEIKDYSLELTYDENMFDYQGDSKVGTLTENWGYSASNWISDGLLRVGGFTGDPANAIPVGSTGTLIKIILVVNCTGCGSSSTIRIDKYDDGIKEMTPQPAETTFNYQ